ncbi:hypothetical protein FQN60_001950 [Etheostoma spectabile]|uniref:Uncharacterized protein n=1 Tax=Etheostoma spectabile TaxID=54343 RepID=A0A5J5DA06_9PERO|nr:hypothetical protein FQN60_001950 [Etheostoma spectabile]
MPSARHVADILQTVDVAAGTQGWDVCLLSARGSDNDTVQSVGGRQTELDGPRPQLTALKAEAGFGDWDNSAPGLERVRWNIAEFIWKFHSLGRPENRVLRSGTDISLPICTPPYITCCRSPSLDVSDSFFSIPRPTSLPVVRQAFLPLALLLTVLRCGMPGGLASYVCWSSAGRGLTLGHVNSELPVSRDQSTHSLFGPDPYSCGSGSPAGRHEGAGLHWSLALESTGAPTSTGHIPQVP